MVRHPVQHDMLVTEDGLIIIYPWQFATLSETCTWQYQDDHHPITLNPSCAAIRYNF